MRLRVTFKEPNTSGSPDYNICGQGLSTLDYSGLTLTAYVNGVQIFTTTDFDAYTIPGTTFDADGVDVTALKEGNNDQVLRMNIDLANVYDTALVKIVASKSGYKSFDKTFTVYGYDLGNNTDGAISGRDEFNIIMIPTANNVVVGLETKDFASFIAYRKPFSEFIHIYRNNSSTLDGYYIDVETEDTLLSSFDGIISHEDSVAIQARVGDCKETVTVEKDTFLVPFNLSISNVGGSDEGYVTDTSDIEAGVGISPSEVVQYYIDDVLTYPTDDVDVTMEIVNADGIVVDSKVTSITLSDSGTWANLFWSDIIIDVDKFNLFKVTFSYLSGSITETKSKTFEIRKFYAIEETTSVNEYRFYNYGDSALTVEVHELQSDLTFKQVWDFSVDVLDTYLLSIKKDGVYKIEYTQNDTTEIQVIAAYDNFKSCLVSVINKIVCTDTTKTTTAGCGCSSNSTSDFYDFTSIIIHSHTYFNLVAQLYTSSFYYTSLSNSKLQELADIKSLIDNLDKTCSCQIDTPQFGFLSTDCEDSNDNCNNTTVV